MRTRNLAHWTWALLLAGYVGLIWEPYATQAQTTSPSTSSPQAGQAQSSSEHSKRMMMRFTPELRQKVMALSPELKAAMQQLQGRHTRHSESLTLRQVMQEILADYQSMVAAIAVDNAEQAADSARRLANHRIPAGGLLPYLPLHKITTDTLSVLPAMNQVVEGNAVKLAEAAERGDMASSARLLGDIAAGCVGCHQVFRGPPGQSPRLLPPPVAK
ncbi:MAG: hypothetical protein OEU26_35425 [Candidatus Tectomicrobia bacterium]|nr:hypothetical protein [Candidatus Tectomicrobia bacterium]